MNKFKTIIIATGVENTKLKVELNEDQKNLAVDNDLIHHDGKEWKFFDDYLPLIESLKKAHPGIQ
jgi:NOL1/NOP2/fmu family ribosome biogenesis protein